MSDVWLNANLATMVPGEDGYGSIEDGAVAVVDGRIAWVGTRQALPEEWRGAIQHDCGGAWITPGLIDCHTHIVHAGCRAGEFEQRLEGVSYEDIARAGGGILSTVRATRAASDEQLRVQSCHRLVRLLAEGVTTVEVKSGYGLDTATECKMLRVAGLLAEQLRFRLSRTFLGAHALPPEYAGRADDYVELVCTEMLPTVAREHLADAVDVFCEHIAFTRTAAVDLGHLNPVPPTREMLGIVAEHAREISAHCGKPIILENITSHVRLTGDLSETDFLNELCERADCGLLLN